MDPSAVQVPRPTIIYADSSSYARTYAEWIAEEIQGDLSSLSQALANPSLAQRSLLVFGSSLGGRGLEGLRDFRRLLGTPQDQKLVFFAVGIDAPRPGLDEELTALYIPEELRRASKLFYLRAGYDQSKLGFVSRFTASLAHWAILLKKEKTPEERGLLGTYDKDILFTRRENLGPLLTYALTQSPKSP